MLDGDFALQWGRLAKAGLEDDSDQLERVGLPLAVRLAWRTLVVELHRGEMVLVIGLMDVAVEVDAFGDDESIVRVQLFDFHDNVLAKLVDLNLTLKAQLLFTADTRLLLLNWLKHLWREEELQSVVHRTEPTLFDVDRVTVHLSLEKSLRLFELRL